MGQSESRETKARKAALGASVDQLEAAVSTFRDLIDALEKAQLGADAASTTPARLGAAVALVHLGDALHDATTQRLAVVNEKLADAVKRGEEPRSDPTVSTLPDDERIYWAKSNLTSYAARFDAVRAALPTAVPPTEVAAPAAAAEPPAFSAIAARASAIASPEHDAAAIEAALNDIRALAAEFLQVA